MTSKTTNDTKTIVSRKRPKRKQAKGKADKKIATIARRQALAVVRRSTETKVQFFNMTPSVTKGSIISYNLAYYMAQGVDSQKFIGNRAYVRGVKFNFHLTNGAAQPVEALHVDVAIVATTSYATLTSLTNNDILDPNLITAPALAMDSEKGKVFWQKRYTIQPPSASQRSSVIVDDYVAINKEMVFKDYLSDFRLKDYNYYLVLRPWNVDGTQGTSVILQGLGFTQIFYQDA